MSQLFFEGDMFVNVYTNKIGTVKRLRNDEYERRQRMSNKEHFYYHVDYDDGSFETYENQMSMVKLGTNDNTKS